MSTPVHWRRRPGGRWVFRILLALVVLYVLLLLPDSQPPRLNGAGKQAFRWHRDAFWKELEIKFREVRGLTAAERRIRFNAAWPGVQAAIDRISETNLPPGSPAFDVVEAGFFDVAPLAAVCPEQLPEFLSAAGRLRQVAKWQSVSWSTNAPEARQRIYRLLYGSRAAVEEVLLQSAQSTNALAAFAAADMPATPSAVVHGFTLHSGDILVSRGGTPVSALIARGNDFPGNFSHIALVHVDEQTGQVSVIESHIESGVGVRPIEEYFADTKLRILVLRLRRDLPALVADPLLPHRAASLAVRNGLAQHTPYDFAMDDADPARQFCSEVAAVAYQSQGVTLWANRSHLSTPGVTSWLAALGVRNFESLEPSDLEYDPQLRVVAEWRDPQTLFKDHVDNAVIDVMLEGADHGEQLDYNLWMLPFARVAKAWSVLLNSIGKVGPVPEGMNATTALRVGRLKLTHTTLQVQVLGGAAQFQAQHGYRPPYWELVRLAKEAKAGK